MGISDRGCDSRSSTKPAAGGGGGGGGGGTESSSWRSYLRRCGLAVTVANVLTVAVVEASAAALCRYTQNRRQGLQQLQHDAWGGTPYAVGRVEGRGHAAVGPPHSPHSLASSSSRSARPSAVSSRGEEPLKEEAAEVMSQVRSEVRALLVELSSCQRKQGMATVRSLIESLGLISNDGTCSGGAGGDGGGARVGRLYSANDLLESCSSALESSLLLSSLELQLGFLLACRHSQRNLPVRFDLTGSAVLCCAVVGGRMTQHAARMSNV